MIKESAESVVDRWIENTYWQYFTGEYFFQNKHPFNPNKIEDSSNTKINNFQ